MRRQTVERYISDEGAELLCVDPHSGEAKIPALTFDRQKAHELLSALRIWLNVGPSDISFQQSIRERIQSDTGLADIAEVLNDLQSGPRRQLWFVSSEGQLDYYWDDDEFATTEAGDGLPNHNKPERE